MKYKRIDAALHNFADSFASGLNWAAGNYVMGHLLRAAIAAGVDTFEVDLVTGSVSPRTGLAGDVESAIRARAASFPAHLESEGVDANHLSHPVMHIGIDLGSVRRLPPPGELDARFRVAVTAVDDRGKPHVGEVRGTWGTDIFS